MNLKHKGRYLIIPIVLILLVISISNRIEYYSKKVRKFETYVVQQGDTLWEISKQVNPGQDPRKTVYEIQKLNDGITPVIQPGQEILVPEE